MTNDAEPLSYFIDNCIEYKKGKKILFDDMYSLFDGFCPAFCDKNIVKSISKGKFIKYFKDKNFDISNDMLQDYKFKYEDDMEDDMEDDNKENNKENIDEYEEEFYDTNDSDIIEYYKL